MISSINRDKGGRRRPGGRLRLTLKITLQRGGGYAPEVATAVLHAVGFDVLDTMMGYDAAVIVDACQMGMKPGTMLEISPEEMFRQDNLVNSHAVTLGSTLRTGQMLFPEEMPDDLKLILVEVEDISTFSTQCTPVIADVVERIRKTALCCQR